MKHLIFVLGFGLFAAAGFALQAGSEFQLPQNCTDSTDAGQVRVRATYNPGTDSMDGEYDVTTKLPDYYLRSTEEAVIRPLHDVLWVGETEMEEFRYQGRFDRKISYGYAKQYHSGQTLVLSVLAKLESKKGDETVEICRSTEVTIP